MIDLHVWPTPNGYKISILLEEIGLPYTVKPVDIRSGAQFDPDFLKIAPNNKMPAIVDHDGPGSKPFALFESGAIMLYLAEKTGEFWPQSMADRHTMIQWLMFQMGGVGPMFGQCHHFRAYAPEAVQYAIDRYTNETKRLYGVLDSRLGEVEYLAGDYGLADMATFPWTRSYQRQGVDIDEFPNVRRWFDAINERPAVQKGLELLKDEKDKPVDDKAKEFLFGSAQYQRR